MEVRKIKKMWRNGDGVEKKGVLKKEDGKKYLWRKEKKSMMVRKKKRWKKVPQQQTDL